MKHTPGPWKWIESGGSIYLSTPDRGRLTVMDFVRRGMSGAQPRFSVWEGEERGRLGGVMKKAEAFDNLYTHPDACVIGAAPDLLEALEGLLAVVTASDPSSEMLPSVEKARAAVARAKVDVVVA